MDCEPALMMRTNIGAAAQSKTWTLKRLPDILERDRIWRASGCDLSLHPKATAEMSPGEYEAVFRRVSVHRGYIRPPSAVSAEEVSAEDAPLLANVSAEGVRLQPDACQLDLMRAEVDRLCRQLTAEFVQARSTDYAAQRVRPPEQFHRDGVDDAIMRSVESGAFRIVK